MRGRRVREREIERKRERKKERERKRERERDGEREMERGRLSTYSRERNARSLVHLFGASCFTG